MMKYLDLRNKEVVFSDSAYAAICAETLEFHPNETGGILLGHFHQNRWQVLEAIDPGPGAISTPTTFSYDLAYVNHLAAKISRQYRQPLQLIGLWHRHPGSFDRFSLEDDATNHRFAKQSHHGALSCLINLDPDFRITAYHVPISLRYRRLSVCVGDHHIDTALRERVNAQALHPDQLRAVVLGREMQGLFQRRPCKSAPLQGPVANELDQFLQQLESQDHWRYGLKACAKFLQVALVERLGPKRQLWELHADRRDQITAWREGRHRLSIESFFNYLQTKNHDNI